MQWTLSAIAAAVALLVLANRRNDLADALGSSDVLVDAPDDEPQLEQGQGGGAIDWLAVLDVTTYLPTMNTDDQAAANERAFLLTIRKAEGTAGDRGYRTMFGYRYFESFADHPRKPARFTDASGVAKWTSAAGAYQFMAVSPLPFGNGSTRVDTWDRMQAKLGLPDFSPASQDLAALELIRECGALNDVRAGRFETAISKCRKTWASLPGAGYGQPERSIATLRTAFLNAGGVIA